MQATLLNYAILGAAFMSFGLGCASKAGPGPLATEDAGTETDGGASADAAGDVSAEAGGSKAARCATEFGAALTAPYGRLDGTVLAIVKPTDLQCTLPNSTHLTLQVLAGGKVYRMVTNVVSTRVGISPDVRFAKVNAPLPPPVFSEGWHVGVPFDYVTTLNVHTASFAPLAKDQLVQTLDDAIALDSGVSVFATTSGGASAHLVHRNKTDQDGAIVLAPNSPNPTFLLFHFEQQVF
jgi:hypothetical protein